MDLVKIITESGVENVLFIVPLRPLRKILGISFTSSSDEYVDVPAVVDEKRYKLEEHYKITLRSTYPSFGKEHFYVSDLKQLIRSGQVKMFTKVTV